MKKKTILIIVALLIIIGFVFLAKSANAPTLSPLGDANDIGTTTGAGNASSTNGAALSTTTKVTIIPAITSDKEVQRDINFSCKDKKAIEAKVYIGGKNPRIDINLVDYAAGVNGVQNESRSFTLPQVPVAEGVRYVSKDGAVVFSGLGDDAFIEENGKPIFFSCVFLNSQLSQ